MSDQRRDNELQSFVAAKEAKLQQTREEAKQIESNVPSGAELAVPHFGIESYPVGRFEDLASIRLRWIKPDLFEFIPKLEKPFAFIRADQSRVEPRTMITDGGSVPRLFHVRTNFSPWGYAPAYLLHDWEFELHHCNRTGKSFEDVRDTLMEAIRTLMESGVCPKSTVDFAAIALAVSSPIARTYWDRNPPVCTLPPDDPE